MLNTTSGPQPKGDPTGHVVNTSRLVEEDLVYTDEGPEILAVLPATGWHAVVGDTTVPLAAFVALDTASMYGVAVGESGSIDLTDNNVEKLDGFIRYAQAINHEEEK